MESLFVKYYLGIGGIFGSTIGIANIYNIKKSSKYSDINSTFIKLQFVIGIPYKSVIYAYAWPYMTGLICYDYYNNNIENHIVPFSKTNHTLLNGILF